MSPTQTVAMLDRQIAQHGQAVTLRRPVPNGDPIEHSCRAFVRGYAASELEGGLQQGDTRVILSPTGLPAGFADADATRLRENDDIEFDGRSRSVRFVETVRVAGALVRLNVTVEG